MVSINEQSPDFELSDLQGRLRKLSDYRGKIVIINFWSVDCPHSERTDHHLVNLLERWNGEVVLLSIAANQNESIQRMEETSQARHIPTVLVDTDCIVANLYQAVTTPHVFILDREGILCYRGAVDNVMFRQRKPSRFFLEETVEALLERRLPELSETPAYGCAIVREI